MKRRLFMIFGIIIMVSGCTSKKNYNYEVEKASIQETGVDVTTSKKIVDDIYLNDNSTEAVSAIMNVIRNQDRFLFGKKNEDVSIKEYCIENYSHIMEEKNCYIDKDNLDLSNFFTNFCVIDLDNDGKCEVILEDGIGTRLVFHYDESVYAYDFNFRGMKKIKEDGTFESSDSAAVTEILQLKFVNKKYKYEEVCISDGLDLDNTIYKINGKDATKEQIDHFLEEQNKKEDAVWHAFNEYLKPYILR